MSEREIQIPYDITCMWKLTQDTNKLIYETETDSQTQRTDLWLPSGRRGGEGWIECGKCKLLYMECEQQGPTVQHRELYSISYNKP